MSLAGRQLRPYLAGNYDPAGRARWPYAVNNDIGVASTNLEADIRSSQKIKDDWTVEGSVSDTMAAYISYPQDMSDHTFSVYVNRPGFSFGYFFRGGGSLSGVERGIIEIGRASCRERV